MKKAVCHNMVQVLAHYYAENWQKQGTGEADRTEETGNVIRVAVTGIEEAASGMDFLLARKDFAKEIPQWKKNDMDFLCEFMQFHKAHKASRENEAFLRECLAEAAGMYSDLMNTVVVDVKKA